MGTEQVRSPNLPCTCQQQWLLWKQCTPTPTTTREMHIVQVHYACTLCTSKYTFGMEDEYMDMYLKKCTSIPVSVFISDWLWLVKMDLILAHSQASIVFHLLFESLNLFKTAWLSCCGHNSTQWPVQLIDAGEDLPDCFINVSDKA